MNGVYIKHITFHLYLLNICFLVKLRIVIMETATKG